MDRTEKLPFKTPGKLEETIEMGKIDINQEVGENEPFGTWLNEQETQKLRTGIWRLVCQSNPRYISPKEVFA